MELSQAILIAFGGNAGLIAILAVLAKSLLGQLVVRDTKVFESELKAKTDAEIERLKNEMVRNVESYKVQLKKSEVFFQRELEAASTFSSLFHSILPGYNNPLMDWHDACDAIAQDFSRIETLLSDFMSKHGAMLNDTERALLVDATSDAGYGKFEIDGPDVDSVSNKKADQLYQKLKKLEVQLLQRVRAQASH